MIASGKDRTACSPGRQTLEEKKDRKKTKTEILHPPFQIEICTYLG